ncbi:hypothetical protein XENTR_v10006310 [Xenopus tropicalis]|uniref:Ankyrin repeat domain-containing protein SOWAHC n=1 Tax=Xenopus tropicalis TaxID=8364 RepID=F7BYX3_XENTR|nr:ankyrin repeat domain-containing protein SOWAHC [Xenopus tropicalis]KAE8625534.1 hypothetical protein XENTR_v10006310 [Xenopus tropicalis]|eukprot:XP_004911856.1 PREDICTED: ankyrin repeat domain-containing protein SOWAHC [Xenopus tropicalis]
MTGLSRESVIRFLSEQGGRVPNQNLLGHFKELLNEPPAGESRESVRSRFKDIVNELATVKEEAGVRYVCLRKKYRESGTGAPSSESSASDHEAASESPGHSSEGESKDLPSPPSISVTEAPGGAAQQPQEKEGNKSVPGSLKQCPGSPEVFLPSGRTPRGSRRGVRDPVSPQFRRGPPLLRAGMRDSDSSSLHSSSSVSGNEEEEGGAAHGQAALDPVEHAWMLSSCRGRWESLRELLSNEPGLITRRDFITGFSCLHWAAKHGQHELLAALLSYAHQHRVPVNINARAAGGYTALHLAAMHGHLDVIKLLIGAYDADVDIRDYSGRKAWQYLGPSTTHDVQGLVGALPSAGGEEEEGGNTGSGRWRLSKVLPSQLIVHRLSQLPEEQPEGPGAGGSRTDIYRKGSGVKGKPRLNKIRFRTQIIHNNLSSRDTYEQEDKPLKSPMRLRPKSNVFG